jgi:hypothetical protein
MIGYIEIIYEKEPCWRCKGQIMSIFIGQEMIERRCVKCDNKGIRSRSRPSCKEERLGFIMDRLERDAK